MSTVTSAAAILSLGATAQAVPVVPNFTQGLHDGFTRKQPQP